MSETPEVFTEAAQAAVPQPAHADRFSVEFRRDLAFPRFSDEVLGRLAPYGCVESVPSGTCLYTYGDRDTDMLVVLSGEVESRLLVEGGNTKFFRSLPAVSLLGN